MGPPAEARRGQGPRVLPSRPPAHHPPHGQNDEAEGQAKASRAAEASAKAVFDMAATGARSEDRDAAAGMAAAYVGGRTDSVLMRIADIQLSFPPILIALILLALLVSRAWPQASA